MNLKIELFLRVKKLRKERMGIRCLNRFLKENAASAIKLCGLSELSGKKIAVDISIYMYRFASDNSLIENMYVMLTTFRYYNIIPIFIFDGKPPPEKQELLQQRKRDRQAAEQEYHQLLDTLKRTDLDEHERHEIQNAMDMLKKDFVTLQKSDIDVVKQLIRAHGCTYYDAIGEADELCAMLTIKDKVWACLSEDMDMFVYGCPRVIRYLSLLNHTAVIYDVKSILVQLGISQTELREICVLSGTDYNIHNHKDDTALYKTLKLFKKYHKSQSSQSFYGWLQEHHAIQDIDMLMTIYTMFDLNTHPRVNLKPFEKIKIMNGPIQHQEIRDILRTDGFLFP